MPVHAREVVASVKQDGPKFVKDALLFPASEGAVDADVIAKLSGKGIPLTPRAQTINDAITGFALVNARATHPRRRIMLGENRRKDCPQFIGQSPNRGQR